MPVFSGATCINEHHWGVQYFEEKIKEKIQPLRRSVSRRTGTRFGLGYVFRVLYVPGFFSTKCTRSESSVAG